MAFCNHRPSLCWLFRCSVTGYLCNQCKAKDNLERERNHGSYVLVLSFLPFDLSGVLLLHLICISSELGWIKLYHEYMSLVFHFRKLQQLLTVYCWILLRISSKFKINRNTRSILYCSLHVKGEHHKWPYTLNILPGLLSESLRRQNVNNASWLQ